MFDTFQIGNYKAISLIGEARLPENGFSVSFTGDFGFWYEYPDSESLATRLAMDNELLSNFDLRVINLEFILPATRGREKDIKCDAISLDYLKGSIFDIVSLANNHAAVFGIEGVTHNIESLKQAGKSIIGVKDSPVAKISNIGIYSLTDLLDDSDPDHQIYRTSDKEIQFLLSELDDCEVVIGFPHLGSRSIYPSPRELDYVKKLQKAGTDLIVCTGSHFPKGFVSIDGNPVCFGLGNYLFDWAGGDTEPVGMHVVANFTDEGLTQLFAIPFNNQVTSECSGVLTNQEFENFLKEFEARSTDDLSCFWNDPRTQAGVMDRLKNLDRRKIKRLRPRHIFYGLRAIWAKLVKR